MRAKSVTVAVQCRLWISVVHNLVILSAAHPEDRGLSRMDSMYNDPECSNGDMPHRRSVIVRGT
jgi:hypothetical protein